MEYQGINTIKAAYSDTLYQDGKIERAADIKLKDYQEPVFEGLEVHPESIPNLESIQDAIQDISIDLMAINQEIISCANRYQSLINNVGKRFKAADAILDTEEERIKDLNTICGYYNEFESVRTLNYKYFKGSFGHDGNYIFHCNATGDRPQLQVLSVTGNGYEGNAYVYDRIDGYQNRAVDTSNRKYMVDNNNYLSCYEYSRLTASKRMASYPSDVNYDSIEAECTITLGSKKPVGAIKITSNMDNLVLEDLKYSTNSGGTYISALDHEIEIMNKEAIYKQNGNYAYGSGIICFPGSDRIRLTFRSKGVTNDKLAYNVADTTVAESPIVKTIELPAAQRHVIRLNDIHAISSSFTTASVMQSVELISAPVDSIAIFANEYEPQHFQDRLHFEYILTVNGIDYNITPVNSNRDGLKVIRFSHEMEPDSYSLHINESIKSAYLKVLLYSDDSATTPVLSNLKICYGKTVTK